jgi:hypothetical protein
LGGRELDNSEDDAVLKRKLVRTALKKALSHGLEHTVIRHNEARKT